VDEKVLNDHRLYEKNKDKKGLIEQIEFPSIQKKETAQYIFEFINFLGARSVNNSISGFSRLEEIKVHLLNQWSLLFQRLLFESRTSRKEQQRYRDFSESLSDLKAVILASVATPGLRETAKGAIQFRHLIEFVSNLRRVDSREVLSSNISWEALLQKAGIVEMMMQDDPGVRWKREVLLILDDGTFYICRYGLNVLDQMGQLWAEFVTLESKSRAAIIDALLEDGGMRRSVMLRYRPTQVADYLASSAGAGVGDRVQDAPSDAAPSNETAEPTPVQPPAPPLSGPIASDGPG
jgi:hypothetical protein